MTPASMCALRIINANSERTNHNLTEWRLTDKKQNVHFGGTGLAT